LLAGTTEAKGSAGRPKLRCEGNIKVKLREIRCEGLEWIRLPQNRALWRPRLNTVTNLLRSVRDGEFTDWLSDCQLLHGVSLNAGIFINLEGPEFIFSFLL
jgi:hypothetical protein